MKKTLLLLLFCFVVSFSIAQTVQVLVSDKKTSMRGLSVVNDKVIWVSGSKGTVGKSIDGGDTFTWMTVKGFEKTDFRDIEAFDAKNAIIMGIDTPAYILKTKDGGETWDVVYENKTTGMFLDAMEFWNEMSGIVIGDPIDNKIFIARTFDGGKTWRALPDKYFPTAEKGEACFASSGTNVAALNLQEAVFVTGGVHSRMFIRDKKIELPIIQGKETTGANSIGVKRVKKKTTVIIVGGDFTTKDSTTQNCCITTDGGNTFSVPVIAPHGYRSCVEFLNADNWITCGINGVDYSKDNGKTWAWISKEGFNVCRKAKKGKAVFFAGNGKIGRLVL
ncbi:WD40/YVTN/BNR-like repeat-containing protein [Ferruginibacter profundus]